MKRARGDGSTTPTLRPSGCPAPGWAPTRRFSSAGSIDMMRIEAD